jgi:hypothetical protein
LSNRGKIAVSDSFKVCLIALFIGCLPLIGSVTYFPLIALVFCEVVAALCLMLGFEWSIQEFYQEQYRKRKRLELKDGTVTLEAVKEASS